MRFILSLLYALLLSAPDFAPTSVDGKIVVDGITRIYLLDLPAKKESNMPLLIVLHGGVGSGAQAKKSYGLTPMANQKGYATVYPDGLARKGLIKARTWNAGECCGPAVKNDVDDVKFIRQLIDKLIAENGIDPKRVFVTGISNGAMLSYRLACEIPEKITAIAPVAGFVLPVESCGSSVPILHFHSKLDENVPIAGGKGKGLADYVYPSLEQVMNTWVSINHCDTERETLDYNNYSLIRWNNCDTEMSFYLTNDGGHSWPGAKKKPRRRADAPSQALDANTMMFDFFERVGG